MRTVSALEEKLLLWLFREVLLESQALCCKPSRTEDRGNFS